MWGTFVWNYFELLPAVQEEILFNDISIFSSGGHFVWYSGTVWAIEEECFRSNICSNFKKNGAIGLGVDGI